MVDIRAVANELLDRLIAERRDLIGQLAAAPLDKAFRRDLAEVQSCIVAAGCVVVERPPRPRDVTAVPSGPAPGASNPADPYGGEG